MAIHKFAPGLVTMAAPFTVSSSDPLDTRLVVDTFNDLTNINTFGRIGDYVKVYGGMQVYVLDTKETYMYAGPVEDSGVNQKDVSGATNWRKISSSASSIDQIEENFNEIASAAGISGTASAHTFGYSAHTTPEFVSAQTPSSIQTEIIAIEKALTPTTNTDETVSAKTAGIDIHNNIIKITKDGIEAFADLHYNSSTNKLTFVNTNGSNEIQLTGVNLIKDARYNPNTEQIEIDYQPAGSTGVTTVYIPVKGIIEEYDFMHHEGYVRSEDDYNVELRVVRDETSGQTKVYGEIQVFDCGTY